MSTLLVSFLQTLTLQAHSKNANTSIIFRPLKCKTTDTSFIVNIMWYEIVVHLHAAPAPLLSTSHRVTLASGVNFVWVSRSLRAGLETRLSKSTSSFWKDHYTSIQTCISHSPQIWRPQHQQLGLLLRFRRRINLNPFLLKRVSSKKSDYGETKHGPRCFRCFHLSRS